MNARKQQQGFTLLEMLVVLLLLALTTGIVAPRASRWLDAAQERGWRADLKARIEMLPVRAFLSGEAMTLDIRQLTQDLPGQSGGVELRLKAPLRYSASGAAVGGELELVRGDVRERWVIEPISGAVRELQGAPH